MALAISLTNDLVSYPSTIGGMNAQRFSDFLAQTRLNLDPNENVIFIYDGTPAHHNPANSGQITELKKLPPYSPFLNIVEQGISALEAAIKTDISRPDVQQQMNAREEARRQRNVGTITPAK